MFWVILQYLTSLEVSLSHMKPFIKQSSKAFLLSNSVTPLVPSNWLWASLVQEA